MRPHHSESPGLGRRSFLALAAAAPALAQTPRDWTNNQPVRYPDPDVVALDKSFATVGLIEVTVPGSDASSVKRTTRVRTTTRAVTGVVKVCTIG